VNRINDHCTMPTAAPETESYGVLARLDNQSEMIRDMRARMEDLAIRIRGPHPKEVRGDAKPTAQQSGFFQRCREKMEDNTGDLIGLSDLINELDHLF